MSSALVAIGVATAPPLVRLDGAIEDANSIAEWARNIGYEHVRTFTDEDGSAVDASDIYAYCKELLSLQDPDRLVIFFSGHGYSPLPGHELWLLSDWRNDANAAINATVSVQIAHRFKRPQISFIADACRVTWNDAQGTTGQVILPKPNPASTQSEVDQFYATRFGNVSQQFQPAELLASYGVFSKEVLKALQGAAHIERNQKLIVTSRSLQDYLREAVPAACERIRNAAIQDPDTNPQWRQPRDVYVELAGPRPIAARGPTPHPGAAAEGIPSAVSEARSRRDLHIAEDARRYRAAEGRESFETGTGFTIVGAEVDKVFVDKGNADAFPENDAWQIRISSGQHGEVGEPSTALVRLAGDRWQGYWIALPAFPQLIGTALIDEDGFSSLNYRPARRFRYSDTPPVDIEEALAQAAAMFRRGVMPSRARLDEIIELLRHSKFDNPALAIVAAYICHRVGDFDQIVDMERYPIGRGGYTPYDLLLLSGRREPADGRTVIGKFPFMSTGWGVLSGAEVEFDERLLRVTSGLAPCLWTMADPLAGEILGEVFAEEPQFATV